MKNLRSSMYFYFFNFFKEVFDLHLYMHENQEVYLHQHKYILSVVPVASDGRTGRVQRSLLHKNKQGTAPFLFWCQSWQLISKRKTSFFKEHLYKGRRQKNIVVVLGGEHHKPIHTHWPKNYHSLFVLLPFDPEASKTCKTLKTF